MIPLPTVSLTLQTQMIYLTLDTNVYNRLILTNQSPEILDIYSGERSIRLQPATADIIDIESPWIRVEPTLTAVNLPASVAAPSLQMQAILKDEDIRENYPLSVALESVNPSYSLSTQTIAATAAGIALDLSSLVFENFSALLTNPGPNRLQLRTSGASGGDLIIATMYTDDILALSIPLLLTILAPDGNQNLNVLIVQY